MSDTALLDWFESDVIACSSHPLGWEFLVAGEDDEPTTEDAFLIEGDDFREVLRQAKAKQEQQIGGAHA